MNILTYTSLFPSRLNPVHGIFVSQLSQALARLARIQLIVPENGLLQLIERARKSFAQGQEVIQTAEHAAAGIPDHPFDVIRCRFWTTPKILKFIDYRLMTFFSERAFAHGLTVKPDLVHAHYAYPDAAAAYLLARKAGLPLVVTCHGSDVNVLTRYPARRRIIGRTLSQASAVIAVSGALADGVATLGVDPERIHHIPNGVDLSRFPQGDKKEARRKLGLPLQGALIAAVGRLEPVKGYDRLLRAVALLDDTRLILVGDGSLAHALKRQAGELGIAERVIFAGMVEHSALAPYFQAADALAMASHSEGWPTVIYEALACGTPVVAPAVGGIPEALPGTSLGLVLPASEPHMLAYGIREVLGRNFDRSELRRTASLHDWDAVARRYMDLFELVLRQPGPKRREAA